MIFQDLINIFEVLERKGFMYQKAFGSSAKTIQKASTNLTEEVQKTPLQNSCKGVFCNSSVKFVDVFCIVLVEEPKSL